MADKPTESELLQRVDAIIGMLINGFSRKEILQYVSNAKNEDGTYKFSWHTVSDRTIDDYMARANEYFKERSKFIREREIGLAVGRYQTIFMRALNEKEYSPAIRALERMDKITGIEAPQKMEHSGMIAIDTVLDAMPEEQRRSFVQRLAEQSDAKRNK